MRMWINAHAPDQILPCINMFDLPSLRMVREQIELPRKEPQTLSAAGKQLRQIANDLYQMLDKQTPPYRFNRTQIEIHEKDEPDGIVALLEAEPLAGYHG